jgi:hypothetical protein
VQKFKYIFQFISILLCIGILDFTFFGKLIWILPNESAWSTNFFFGYEYHWKKLISQKREKPLVLLIGSSIAAYSFDTKLLKKALEERVGEIDVEILTYAGMTPIDTILLSKNFLSLQPKLIVYPINFIDFRIHREMQIRLESEHKWKERFLLMDSLNYKEAPQLRSFVPFQTLWEFKTILPKESLSEYFLAGLFRFYRYKDLYFDNLRSLYQHRFGRNTSYHGYSGVLIPELVDSLGWTGKKFSFLPKSYMKTEGFYIQIVPEILKNSPLKISFNSKTGKLLQEIEFYKPGWQRIILNKEISNSEYITAELSNIWYAFEALEDRKDFHRDEMGVRLQQTFGLDKPREGLQFEREPKKEDYRYETLNTDEYQEYFEYRLLSSPEIRPGIVYFTSVYNSKKWISLKEFDPNPQYEYLKKWKDILLNSNSKMLMINNPENPITLDLYSSSNWYKDQLKYILSIQSDYIKVYDWKDKLSPQGFSDYHHLTYPAMQKITQEYANIIAKELK